ncbi:hypothetical protein ACFL2V_03175 [Pseudomonadota bacterium]
MKTHRLPIGQSLSIIALYCLPALLVLSYIMYDYHERTAQIAVHISEQWGIVDKAYKEHIVQGGGTLSSLEELVCKENTHPVSPQTDADGNPLPVSSATGTRNCKIEKYFIRDYQKLNHLASSEIKNGSDNNIETEGETNSNEILIKTSIESQIREIWIANSLIIGVMVLVPFTLLGSGMAFSTTLNLSYEQRIRLMTSGWWMKAVVALVIAYGWMYLVNPHGRGGSTIEQFLIAVDLSQSKTLPLFLRDFTITPVIAGFLGWYLYMLTYFFSKMTSDDVASTKAYGALLQKFLFTWGVTIVFIAAQMQENANIIAFVIGYFPMAAFSLVKDKGLSMLQGGKQEKGQLSELPGISRWQIMRLEEEGINSLGSLAYRERESIDQHLPGMSKLVDYWTDISRLYTIVGEDNYGKIRNHCQTASEFIIRAGDPVFIEALAAIDINNTAEYARILPITFPDLIAK